MFVCPPAPSSPTQAPAAVAWDPLGLGQPALLRDAAEQRAALHGRVAMFGALGLLLEPQLHQLAVSTALGVGLEALYVPVLAVWLPPLPVFLFHRWYNRGWGRPSFGLEIVSHWAQPVAWDSSSFFLVVFRIIRKWGCWQGYSKDYYHFGIILSQVLIRLWHHFWSPFFLLDLSQFLVQNPDPNS